MWAHSIKIELTGKQWRYDRGWCEIYRLDTAEDYIRRYGVSFGPLLVELRIMRSVEMKAGTNDGQHSQINA